MTEILKDNLENLLIAANLLNDGKIVVFPTETVYGIGADIFNENALKRIFEIKKRDFSKALTVHISKIEDVQRVAIDRLNLETVSLNVVWTPDRGSLVYWDKETTITDQIDSPYITISNYVQLILVKHKN